MEKLSGTPPKKVIDSVDRFFKLDRQSQGVVLPLIEEATNKAASILKGSRFRQTEEEVAWNNYVRALADRFAQTIDPTYWPGCGGNEEDLTIQRVNFANMLRDNTPETLKLTLNLINWLLYKEK